MRFYWQHDAEWQPGGLVSVFDNGSSPPEEKQSRGLLLDPNAERRHASRSSSSSPTPNATLLASSQGDLLSLPGGNWLMGYGGLPNFTEYDSSGHVLLDAHARPDVQDFRTYLAPWSATPKTRPAVAAQAAGRRRQRRGELERRHRASPRGSVLAGTSASSLSHRRDRRRATASRRRSTVHTSAGLIAVAALDASGATLATSPTVSASG